jgi:hypothetical protein
VHPEPRTSHPSGRLEASASRFSHCVMGLSDRASSRPRWSAEAARESQTSVIPDGAPPGLTPLAFTHLVAKAWVRRPPRTISLNRECIGLPFSPCGRRTMKRLRFERSNNSKGPPGGRADPGPSIPRALSGEVGTGSPPESATNQKARAPLRFNRSEKRSSLAAIAGPPAQGRAPAFGGARAAVKQSIDFLTCVRYF